MTTAAQRAALDEFFTPDVHDAIAKFARESYALHGRGLITTLVPKVPRVPGTTVFVTGELKFSTLDNVRRLFQTVADECQEDGAITLRMIETYDPDRQAVVMVAFEALPGQVSLKLRLERATLVPTPNRVQ